MKINMTKLQNYLDEAWELCENNLNPDAWSEVSSKLQAIIMLTSFEGELVSEEKMK